MPLRDETGRRGDPATKWLVGGTILSLAMMLVFVAGMSDQMRIGTPAGGAPMVLMTLLGVSVFGVLALGPIGRAVSKRLLEGGQGGELDGVLQELDELRGQTDELRQALAEAQERLDFTERLLASGAEARREELH